MAVFSLGTTNKLNFVVLLESTSTMSPPEVRDKSMKGPSLLFDGDSQSENEASRMVISVGQGSHNYLASYINRVNVKLLTSTSS